MGNKHDKKVPAEAEPEIDRMDVLTNLQWTEDTMKLDELYRQACLTGETNAVLLIRPQSMLKECIANQKDVMAKIWESAGARDGVLTKDAFEEFMKSRYLPNKIKICFCGDGCTGGKTSLIFGLLFGHEQKAYIPTTMDSYHVIYRLDGKELFLELVDMAGQSDYESVRVNGYAGANMIIASYGADGGPAVPTNIIKWWLPEVQHYAKNAHFHVIVEGCCDRSHETVPPDEAKEVQDFVDGHHLCGVYKISAKKNYSKTPEGKEGNIRDFFDCVLRAYLARSEKEKKK